MDASEAASFRSASPTSDEMLEEEVDWDEAELGPYWPLPPSLTSDRYASICEAVEEFVRLDQYGRHREAYKFSRKLVRDFPEISEDAQAEIVSRKYWASCHS